MTHYEVWLQQEWRTCQNTQCLSSGKWIWKLHVCYCMHVYVFCWFWQEETNWAECFYHQTELRWKFSAVFPLGGCALYFGLIEVIFHFGVTFTTSYNLYSSSWEVNDHNWLLHWFSMWCRCFNFPFWTPGIHTSNAFAKFYEVMSLYVWCG